MILTALFEFLIWLVDSLLSLLPSLPSSGSFSLEPVNRLIQFVSTIGYWLFGSNFPVFVSLISGLFLIRPLWNLGLFIFRRFKG